MMQHPHSSRTVSPPEANPDSDHLLLNHYLNSRNPEAFLELIHRHSGLVYGTCLRVTANPHDAEELTQECFFNLSRQADQVRTSLVGWLHQTATHLSLNRLRSERRRRGHETQAGQLAPLVIEEEASVDHSWKEIAPLVDEALSRLPEEIRTPLLMHYMEGAPQSEIANELGVHQSTVSRRLSEGINCLRNSLRQAGLTIPATLLASCLISQPIMAGSPALGSAFGKIALAGIGSSLSANPASANSMTMLTGIVKATAAIFLVPAVAGIVWGEIIFLIASILWCSYLGWRRPEWFRVLSYTNQFPNIYEWPFFPFKKWKWQSPPREWKIWMTAHLLTGNQLFALGILWPQSNQMSFGRLILSAIGLWQIFAGLRIWVCARRSLKNTSEKGISKEFPVDGALLLTYTLMGMLIFAWLFLSPRFLAQPGMTTEAFPLIVFNLIYWGSLLLWGSVLVWRRYQRWTTHQLLTPRQAEQLKKLAPPTWLLVLLSAGPLIMGMQLTSVVLIQDILPVYVPFESDPQAIVQQRMLKTTWLAMVFVVLAIPPLSYLSQRIPRILWGVGCASLTLTIAINLAFFSLYLIQPPTLEARIISAPAPHMQLPPGNFIIDNPPNLIENKSATKDIFYLGQSATPRIRLSSAATITLKFSDQQVQLDIPERSDYPETEAGLGIMIAPSDFWKGVPKNLKLSLHISDIKNRQFQINEILLPLPEYITPADWKSQAQFHTYAKERSYHMGETVQLATVQGSSVELTITPLASE